MRNRVLVSLEVVREFARIILSPLVLWGPLHWGLVASVILLGLFNPPFLEVKPLYAVGLLRHYPMQFYARHLPSQLKD